MSERGEIVHIQESQIDSSYQTYNPEEAPASKSLSGRHGQGPSATIMVEFRSRLPRQFCFQGFSTTKFRTY